MRKPSIGKKPGRYDGRPVGFLGDLRVTVIPGHIFKWDVARIVPEGSARSRSNTDFDFHIIREHNENFPAHAANKFNYLVHVFDSDLRGSDRALVCDIMEEDSLEEALMLCAEFDPGLWNKTYLNHAVTRTLTGTEPFTEGTVVEALADLRAGVRSMKKGMQGKIARRHTYAVDVIPLGKKFPLTVYGSDLKHLKVVKHNPIKHRRKPTGDQQLPESISDDGSIAV